MTKVLSCPYCHEYHLLKPKNSEETDMFQDLMLAHCKQEHMDDIIWDVIKRKSKYKLM